jgi:hypothetical protein
MYDFLGEGRVVFLIYAWGDWGHFFSVVFFGQIEVGHAWAFSGRMVGKFI